MSKSKVPMYTCSECGQKASKWQGKCNQCHAWNSFQQSTDKGITDLEEDQNRPISIGLVRQKKATNLKTGLEEFDRVLGGGIVPGSIILLGGDPGVGKSTLLLKVLDNHIQVNSEQKCLYVSAEESSTQVAARAKRMDVNNSNIYLYCEESWQKIVTQVKSLNPSILVIDSIQTISSNEINSIAGSPSQVREITTELMKLVKKNDLSAFIIGHITKEGAIAGPKHLEHMVDVVCYFEKAQSKSYRLLRSKKNRFGTTDEVGIFEMNERGIKAIDEASHLRINERNEDPGKSYSCVIEGTRPLLVEVQALVVENKQSHVKRSVQGYDLNRLQMIIAVMEKYFGLSLSFFDIYINVVGISKSKDLDLDLAIVTAILSSINMQVIPNTTVVLGEIGLTGSTRASKEIEKKIISLKQFGYESAVCGTMNRSCTRSSSIDIIELSNIKDLKTYLEQSNGSKRIAG